MNQHILYYVWRYLIYHKGKSLILWMSLTLTFALPLCLGHLSRLFEQSVRARASVSPLVLGVKGNEYDLTLHALYFKAKIQDTFPVSEWHRFVGSDRGRSAPLALEFTTRSYPIVGTTLEYFEARKLRLQDGSMFVRLGQCVVGAKVGENLDLVPGSDLMSDPSNVFDLAGDYPLKMKVAGVLAPTGTPDDMAVFVDLKTHWIMKGLGHGHEDVAALDSDSAKVMGEKDGVVTASPSVIPFLEINEKNQQSFHFHSAMEELPLTAMLIWPADTKSETLLLGDYNQPSHPLQVIRPLDVLESMMAWVIQIKVFMDLNFLLIGLAVTGLAIMILLLSNRLRKDEFEIFHYLGCRRTFVTRLVIFEWSAFILLALLSTLIILLFADQWLRRILLSG